MTTATMDKLHRLEHRLRIGLSRPSLWLMVALAGVAFALIALYVVNRNAIERNEALFQQHAIALRQSEQAIEYLCETSGKLDVLVVQFIGIGQDTLQTLRGAERAQQQRRLDALRAAHRALSDTRACAGVTG